MSGKFQVGAPMVPPTVEQKDNLVYWVGESLSINNAAKHVGITPDRLYRWLERGGEDCDRMDDTIYAQLYRQLYKNQAIKVSELLKKIESCPKNWQALAWKLEKCVRDEFASDAPEYKELLDCYTEMKQYLLSLKNYPMAKGVAPSGKIINSQAQENPQE